MTTDPISNKDLPIATKSVERDVKIAFARMKRNYNLDHAKWTNFWNNVEKHNKDLVAEKFEFPDEEGLLLTWVDESNWTLLTSHLLIGQINGKKSKLEINKIRKYDFGDVKGLDGKLKELVVKMRWAEKKFIYESNGAGYMLMAGLDVLHTHWEREAIITKKRSY